MNTSRKAMGNVNGAPLRGRGFELLLIAVLLALAGCGGTAEEINAPPVDSAPQAIFYGGASPDLYTSMPTAQQNAVVALWWKYYYQLFCSGTLVSPRVILTAAHCIRQDGYTISPEDIEVHVGADASSPTAALAVQEVHYNTSWDGSERNDVGVVILSYPYNGATPIQIKRGGVSGISGQYTQSVGFGMTQDSTDQNPNMRRYWTSMEVSYVDSSAITVDGNGQTGVAPGDSGGPLLYDFGQGIRVAGVASTSAEGWIYYANYASLGANEAWVQEWIDQFDNPECLSYCSGVECGEVQNCVCGGCERGYECVNHDCRAIQPGTGGVCVTLSPSGDECDSDAECGAGRGCVQYEGDVSECGEICGPEACSANDSDSFCLPLPLQGGGYLSLCLENSPRSCSTEGASCTTPDGRSGLCLQIYEGEPKGCYGYCETVVTCPEGTACIEHVIADCESICAGKECGTVRGCNCGACSGGEVCKQNQCCRPDCGGRDCGTDGCGGSCGECGPGTACNADGECVCQPDCADRACGPNGCGGSCGECDFGQVCTPGGACETADPCQGPCEAGVDLNSCRDETTLCRCNANNSTWQIVDCGLDCLGEPEAYCGFDPETSGTECVCEPPATDGDLPDGDTPDGDAPVCEGDCTPMDKGECLDPHTACLCQGLHWTSTLCSIYCQTAGKVSQGCGLISIAAGKGCICADPIPADGDSPTDGDYPIDGDTPLDGDVPEDGDAGEDGDGGSGAVGSGGCAQTDAPAAWLALAALALAWRRRTRLA
ncbi:MAG: hypothetical protein C4523_15385 [Myxococcales bacterium]|nr:MAG: hypothetical protein C4523_15385 [Myxococcales bacterium]